ncbi:MAG: InlB B-repeat-containing protein [Bacteroidales bacterium]|nr:InlB B-repeat-containing protein [Bacteroidales bacterium]
MRSKFFFILLATSLLLATGVMAANIATTVEQVTSAVTITEDEDFVITSDIPFGEGASVNIANTEHATLILKSVKPSAAASLLGNVKINGMAAVNGENCQVKMYNLGSIILPYKADCNPLTVYSEPNFGGESTNNLPIETFNENRVSENTYMATLTDEQLNNRISSFKLKRGYMVTFAVGNEGWGYSRCFIAADEDLEEAELLVELNNRISSYRIFVWNDIQKKALAADSEEHLNMMNASSTYGWGAGGYISEDIECVPHNIKLGWPGNCGNMMTSCYLKTNNEPGNSADDGGYEPLESVLNTWEDMMRTGKRLLSPSSHDGSISWMNAFIDSIDARGWRCDIVDMHCYWAEWNLNNSLNTYHERYGRPIWVSEFVYGASWSGRSGIFSYAYNKYGTTDTNAEDVQEENLRCMSAVFENWNAAPYIERYFFWNHEATCSKLIVNEEPTLLGEFYRDMDTGLAYNKESEFIPIPVARAPKDLTAYFDENNYQVVLNWVNKNRDLTDEMLVEMRANDGDWQVVASFSQEELDANSDFTYSYQLPEDFVPTSFLFRIHTTEFDGEEHLSATVACDAFRDIEGYHKVTFVNGSAIVRTIMVANGETVSAPGEDYDIEGIILWAYEQEGINKYDFTTPVTKDLTLYAVCEVNLLIGWDAGGDTTKTPKDAGWICSDEESVNWTALITGVTSATGYRDNLDGVDRAFIHGSNSAVFAYPVMLYTGQTYKLSLMHSAINYAADMNYGINSASDNTGTMVASATANAPKWSATDSFSMEGFSVDTDGLYYFTWQTDALDRPLIWDLYMAGGTRPIVVTFETNGGTAVEPINLMAGGRISAPETEREDYLFEGWCTDAELTTLFDFNDPIGNDMTLYAHWSQNKLFGWDGLGEEVSPADAGWTTTDESIVWSTPINSANYDYAHYRDNLTLGRALIHPQSEGLFAYPTLELEAGVTYELSAVVSGMNGTSNQTISINTKADGTGEEICAVTDVVGKYSETTDLSVKFICLADGAYYFLWYSDLTERSVLGKLQLYVDSDSGIATIYAQDNKIVDVYNIMGMRVKSQVNIENALDGLSRGIYIVNGKKILK